MTPERVKDVSRQIEDWGFLIACGLGLLYGIGEIIVYVVVSLGLRPHTEAPFPWIVMAFFIGGILPKTLGRATAGQVWVVLAHGVARLLTRGKNGGAAPTSPATPEEAPADGDSGESDPGTTAPRS